MLVADRCDDASAQPPTSPVSDVEEEHHPEEPQPEEPQAEAQPGWDETEPGCEPGYEE